jgi:spore germination cell wall hydrolase CwlJ-like protein
MKNWISLGLAALLLIYGATASGEATQPADQPASGSPLAQREALDWSGLTRAAPLAARPPSEIEPVAAAGHEPVPASTEIDVVDAHWMALTMWGEARREGEAGMRAVGHVIDNRRKSGRHGGYATDTVSEAYQFSCWNAGDPNRRALDAIDRLPPDSADYRAWVAAKRIAAEILEGRSTDPTAGALFYHTVAVAPRWSAGIAPVRRIGSHLFFLTAR